MSKVSVIIPVYNVEQFLPAAMESVLTQTYKDVEVVLVDDESPDRCGEMCDEYARRHRFVKVIHKQNGGLGEARNSGLEVATGDWVMFLDSDDMLRHDAVEKLLRFAEEYDCDAIHGRMNRFVIPGKFDRDNHGQECIVIQGKDDLLRNAVCNFSQFPGDEHVSTEGSACAALYRRDFLLHNHLVFYSERTHISEDYIFNFEVASHARCIGQIPDTIYHYRVNPHSLTQTFRPDTILRIVDYCRFIEGMMAARVPMGTAKKYAHGYAASRLRAQIKYMFLSASGHKEQMSWLNDVWNIPYFQSMLKDFDYKGMSRLHSINFSLFKAKRFSLLCFLIKIQHLWRKSRGKIEA